MPPDSKIPEDGSWSWADYVTMIKAMNGKEFEGTKMTGTVIAGQLFADPSCGDHHPEVA